MSGAPASLLFPGVLTLLLYLAALFVVVSSRNATLGRRRDPRARIHRQLPDPELRARPRLRVIPGGADAAPRAAGRGA